MTDPQLPVEAPIEPVLAGEEHFRLVTGFADLFTAIVLATGFIALSALGPLAGIAVAAAAWGLSGPIVRQRNFAASGIVLALGFTIGVQVTLGAMLGGPGMIVGAIASWFYWRVFKVPIAAAAAILTPVALVGAMGRSPLLHGFPLFGNSSGGAVGALFWGIVVFAIAMRWDMSDRLRQTRRSDVGFWLHLVAAPLIVRGIFSWNGMRWGPYMSDWQLQPVLILFALLAVIALIVDRRPILVSSLSYLAYAMSAAIDRRELLAGAMTVALLLGGGVLVLAVGWNVMRAWLLKFVPSGWSERLPPPMATGRPVPAPVTPASEKEPLRLIFGFNDIFVSIGLSTLIAGSVMFSIWQFVQFGPHSAQQTANPANTLLDWRLVVIPAAVIWLAAEYFVRQRRMALPSLQLATCFALTAGCGGMLIALRMMLSPMELRALDEINSMSSAAVYPLFFKVALAGALIAAAANLLFWWRHKVPASFALALVCLLPPLFLDVWLGAGRPRAEAEGVIAIGWQARAMLCGLLFFAIAMAFDRSDRSRQTLRCDTAFWLHFYASLLVLPALFSLVHSLPSAPLWLAGTFAGLILLAVAIDRRAPLLVAMPFVISAFATSARTTAMAALAICILLIATTLYWDRLREVLLRRAV